VGGGVARCWGWDDGGVSEWERWQSDASMGQRDAIRSVQRRTGQHTPRSFEMDREVNRRGWRMEEGWKAGAGEGQVV
jgi:hypothetical protein